MRKSLYPKMFFGYLLFGLMSFLVVTIFTAHCIYNYIEKQNIVSLYKEANLISSDYAVSYYNNNITLADFEERLKALSTYLSADIWVVSPSGDILVNSEKNTDLLNIQNIKYFNISDFGNRYYGVGKFYNSFDSDRLSVYAPISINYKIRGYVFIHKPMSSVLSYSNGLSIIFYQSIGIIFLCALMILIIMIRAIIQPVVRLAEISGEYMSGNFETKIDYHSRDEIGFIGASLTYMADELNTLEDDQRKFISNVSHDFRSPLTSIKGYIEAMIDGTIPVENQEKYLNIILFETERLNKLTNSLLELNKYGHRGMMLDVSSFDINDMIRMTARTFEGKCIEKRIGFELVLTGKQLPVQADMSKIQRVIYNLLDNAIKFSHNDSSITIETTKKNEKVFVSVKDRGIGIPKDSLSKIWERFYKSDLSRGKDKRGTGLGLAIVKEIIQAHNENINVISTVDVGTEFIFSLQASAKEKES